MLLLLLPALLVLPLALKLLLLLPLLQLFLLLPLFLALLLFLLPLPLLSLAFVLSLQLQLLIFQLPLLLLLLPLFLALLLLLLTLFLLLPLFLLLLLASPFLLLALFLLLLFLILLLFLLLLLSLAFVLRWLLLPLLILPQSAPVHRRFALIRNWSRSRKVALRPLRLRYISARFIVLPGSSLRRRPTIIAARVSIRALRPVAILIPVPMVRSTLIPIGTPMMTLIALTHDALVRAVVVMLTVDRALLIFVMGIPVPRIPLLVVGQRGERWRGPVVPPVPAVAMTLPLAAPVFSPMGRRVVVPPVKVRRWIPVVTHGDAQDEERNIPRVHEIPGPVVPGAHIPVVILIDPVHAVIKEKIQIQLRCVVDGVTRNPLEFRINRDADPDVDIRGGRRNRPQQHPHNKASGAHHVYLSSNFFYGLIRQIECRRPSAMPAPGCHNALSISRRPGGIAASSWIATTAEYADSPNILLKHLSAETLLQCRIESGKCGFEHFLLQPVFTFAPPPFSLLVNAGAARSEPPTVDIHVDFPAGASLHHIHVGDDIFRRLGRDCHIGRRCVWCIAGFSHHDFGG